jgi:nucleoside-diphosphate-sugar epimerase
MRGKNIYIIGNGRNKIQFAHVKEVADACILMAQTPGSDVFNVGTDRFDTLRNDLETLIAFAQTKSKVVPINPTLSIGTLRLLDKFNLSPLADWHYLTYHKDFYFDISKIKNRLGWQPTYSNNEMLIESYKWYRDHRQQAQSQLGTTHRKAVRQRMLGIVRSLS